MLIILLYYAFNYFYTIHIINKEMRVIIAGGDGFIGWPLSLRLSKDGHEVLIIDNLRRR